MEQPSSLEKTKTRIDAFRMKQASRERIATRQRERLQSLLEFVVRESRFYKHLYEDVERPITDLESLPPVTKSQLMEHFDSVVTDTAVELADVRSFTSETENIGKRFLGRYPVWTTSGTTGEPGIFLQDDWSLLAPDAVGDRWSASAMLNVQTILQVVKHNARTAELAVGGGHFAAASGVEMLRRENPFLRDRMRLTSPDRPISVVANELEAFDPAIIVGYSTVLLELEREQRAGRLNISPVYITPSGEAITDAEKKQLRETFDCIVREVYGATEFYGIAVECGHGNLHANTDWVVLEPVDEDYQPVEFGEPSDTVLVTNLANRIQPLVRYDLGDSVTMYEERCPCGSNFPVLEVEGRQGDVLHFEATGGERVTIFPLPLSGVVEAVSGVRRTQIVQTAPQALSVRLDIEKEADESAVWMQVESDLADFFADQGVIDLTIELASEPPTRNPRSGKFRHVWAAE
ncbi:phenylacetate--CoA ligase family protein [Haloferax sp. DFSO60]|uniref:phenylacetate--CoA ligase family protein n=1 Tax=Haloferax sp. DFSO60 TaxID=3388652 RepID=UPI00397CC22C